MPWPALLARVLANRGVSDAAALGERLGDMIPVGQLPAVGEAARLLAGYKDNGRVLVVGDFDADGATSTALMLRALRGMRFADVDFLVPNRFEFGYGLTPEIVELAATRQPNLIVTVDNGISSVAGANRAAELGMQLLITDHHLPPQQLPRAAVIVNPNLQGSDFPSGNLAGVGVAFYVMAALSRELGSEFPVSTLLDLVSLGTIADLVPMDRNNRVLVQDGLRRIRRSQCSPGILALLQLAGRDPSAVTATDLAFAVAPRLNAAGRLDDMSLGIHCLLADDPARAAADAARLQELNTERREIEGRMQEQALYALDMLAVDQDIQTLPPVLCLYDPQWHQGVVGLVASRLKERTHRPVVAFADDGGGLLKGSARSVGGLHIRDALDNVATRHPGLLEKFGGHAMAAGLSLHPDHLNDFREALEQEVVRWLDGMDLEGVIWTDGTLEADELSLENASLLRDFAPWGQQFPEPRFDGVFQVLESRIVGDNHLKMRVRHPAGRAVWDAIAFRQADKQTDLGQNMHLVYRLDVNEYRGVRRLQLMVEYLQRP